jgi:hypothetical protein
VCPDFLPFLFFLVGTFTVILSVIYRKEKVWLPHLCISDSSPSRSALFYVQRWTCEICNWRIHQDCQ